MSSIERRGWKPLRWSARIASMAPKHSDHAVVLARVRNRVDVRPGGHGGEIGFFAFPPREDVADGVLAQLQAALDAELFYDSARLQVGIGEQNAGDDRWRALGDEREVVDFALEACGIDGNRALHRKAANWLARFPPNRSSSPRSRTDSQAEHPDGGSTLLGVGRRGAARCATGAAPPAAAAPAAAPPAAAPPLDAASPASRPSMERANPSTWKLCIPTTTARYCLSLIL